MTNNVTQNKTSITSGYTPPGDVLVFEYSCRIDKTSLEHINQQIFLSRKLYNDVIACVSSIYQELQSFVIEKTGAGAQELQADIEQLNDAFRNAKALDDEPAMQNIAEQRRGKWKELSTALKATRQTYRQEIRDFYLSRIGINATCETAKIRSQAVDMGLGWATATVVLNSALLAFKKSFSLGKSPRFARGEMIDQDCLSLQFTQAGGVASASILQGLLSDLSMTASNCGRRAYGEMKFRLGAAKMKTFATGTWQYHRPLPEGSNVAVARLVRRKVGASYKWAIQLIVKTKQPVRIQTAERLPLVAVHFGWTGDVNGRRVASLSDCADPSASIIVSLPPRIEEDLQRADQVRSKRDTKRDEIAPQIKLISLPCDVTADLTDIFDRVRKTRPQDISANRVHYLCRLLKQNDSMPEWLETWRKEDKLQWQAQTHIARRARNARKTFYREQAINIAKRYDTIAIEPLDLASAAIKVNAITGTKTEFSAKARSGRVVAALYELESALRWAAAKTGASVLDVVANTATQCSICSGKVQPTKDNHQLLVCSECGAVLDRKQNGSAMAWQLVNEVREDAVTTFWLEHFANIDENKLAKETKQQKLNDARKKPGLLESANPE